MNLSARLSRPTVRLAIVVALLAGGGSVFLVVGPGSGTSHAASPPTAGQLLSGLADRSNGTYLRLQLDPAQPHYGAFAVGIAGVGLAWPTTPATVTPNSANDTQVRYDGSGYLDAQATLDPEFGVNYQMSGAQSPVQVQLIGHVDPAHRTGGAELWINGTHYQLNAQSAPSQKTPADSTVSAVLGAYRANDWTALFALTDSSLTRNQTQAQFTNLLVTGLSGGRISDAKTTGPVTYTTTSAGINFAEVPVTLTLTAADGTSQPGAVTMRLIYDTTGAWHLLTLA